MTPVSNWIVFVQKSVRETGNMGYTRRRQGKQKQSRETGNIGYTRLRQTKQKHVQRNWNIFVHKSSTSTQEHVARETGNIEFSQDEDKQNKNYVARETGNMVLFVHKTCDKQNKNNPDSLAT